METSGLTTQQKLEHLRNVNAQYAETVESFIDYLYGCTQDKYGAVKHIINTEPLMGGDGGFWFNTGNIIKCIQRYVTKGFEKSYKVSDLFKIADYSLREICRRKNEHI